MIGKGFVMTSLLNDQRIHLAGQFWTAQNAGRTAAVDGYDSWSIPGDGTQVAQVRPGDRAPFDPDGKVRSELACSLRLPYAGQPGSTFEGGWHVMLDAGPVTDREWLILGQIHQDDVPGNVGSPPFAFNIANIGGIEYLQLNMATSPHVPNLTYAPLVTIGRVPFTRGVWHTISFLYIDSHGGSSPKGAVQVLLDGVVFAVDWSRIPGYAYGILGSYLKLGIYAQDNGVDGLTAHYKNVWMVLK